MLNLSISDCRQGLETSNSLASVVTTALIQARKDIKILSENLEYLERKLAKENRRKNAFARATLLITPLPVEITKARAVLLRKVERSKREDITVGASLKLREEVAELAERLRQKCQHPFVLEEKGYIGSDSHDHDDACPALRRCVVCGFDERSSRSRECGPLGLEREWLFNKLVGSSKRIIEREPIMPRGKFNIEVPLGAALRPFEESVAKDLNA